MVYSLLLVYEIEVPRSQHEMRTFWRILFLGWRNLGFAMPERDAHPMVHIHSEFAKLKYCIPRTRCEPYGAHSFWMPEKCSCVASVRRLGAAFVASMYPGVQKSRQHGMSVCAVGFALRSGNAEPKCRKPKMNVHHRVHISFWECKT